LAQILHLLAAFLSCRCAFSVLQGACSAAGRQDGPAAPRAAWRDNFRLDGPANSLEIIIRRYRSVSTGQIALDAAVEPTIGFMRPARQATSLF